MFLDPTGTISLALPAGWAWHAVSSSLTHLAFSDWRAPAQRQIFVHVRRASVSPHVSIQDWRAAVEETLPDEVTRVEYRPPGTLLVERPGREGRLDQRWAIIRGARLDTTIEQLGVPLGSALSTRELAVACESLRVPVNDYLGPPRQQREYEQAMQEAFRAFQESNSAAAARAVVTAQNIARQTWLHSLVGFPLAEIPAAVAVAEAALRLATITGAPMFLQQAAGTLHRCRASLEGHPAAGAPALGERVDALLRKTYELHGSVLEEAPPVNDVSACLMRCQLAVREVQRARANGQLVHADPIAATAVDDALSAAAAIGLGRASAVPLPAAFVERLVQQGIEDSQHQRRLADELLEIQALQHVIGMGNLQLAVRIARGLRAEREPSENLLFAARRLAELSPSDEHSGTLALALTTLAGALIDLGDEVSLELANAQLEEAEALVNTLPDSHGLYAQVLLDQGFLRYASRVQEGAIEILDRAIEFARHAKAARIERAALSLRSLFFGLARRHEEALRDATAALKASDDDAASVHFLNQAVAFANIGQRDAALRSIEAGLAAAIPDEPFGDEVVHLLVVGAQSSPTPGVRLSATEAAAAVTAARRVRLDDRVDRMGFDDALKRREMIGALVTQRVATGDFWAALATADGNRARSLADLHHRARTRGAPARQLALPAKDAGFEAQIAYLQRHADDFIASHGGAPPLQADALREIVCKHGRCIVLFHPTNSELLIFVVRPGAPAQVVTATSRVPVEAVEALTARLRQSLGIGVATRAARGALPPQTLDELTEILADDGESHKDAELVGLSKELHAALFSAIDPPLHEGEPVTVVPYRGLSVLPLGVLVDSEGVTLGARHPISVLPSIASLAALKRHPASVRRALVVGDPSVSPELGLQPLPGAAGEAEDVHARLMARGIDTALLLGPKATEANVRAATQGSHIIHFACHAALREPASASPLFLTPQPPDDGLLLANEIADLQLEGALVVLAACESGLGRATVDGVLGLGRAFLEAGARTAVLSLWRVSDAATRVLMGAFYDALLGTASDGKGARDVATALHYAQDRARAHGWSHPTEWGPWVIVGDGAWRVEG